MFSRTGGPSTGEFQNTVILAWFREVDLDPLGEWGRGVISQTAPADQTVFDFALVPGSVMRSSFAQTESAVLGPSEWEA